MLCSLTGGNGNDPQAAMTNTGSIVPYHFINGVIR